MMRSSVLATLAVCFLSGTSSNALEILADNPSDNQPGFAVFHDVKSDTEEFIAISGKAEMGQLSSYLITGDHGEMKDGMVLSKSTDQANPMALEFVESAFYRNMWVIGQENTQKQIVVLAVTYSLVFLGMTISLISMIAKAKQAYIGYLGVATED